MFDAQPLVHLISLFTAFSTVTILNFFTTWISQVALDLNRWLQYLLYWDKNQSVVRVPIQASLYLKISLYPYFTFPFELLSLRKFCSFSLLRLTPRFVLFILWSLLSQILITSVIPLTSIFNLFFSTGFLPSAFRYVLVSPSLRKRGSSINI